MPLTAAHHRGLLTPGILRSTALLVALASSACTWVSAKDYADAQALLDNDGDGLPAPGDCDDKDPKVYPGAADTWYDGVDSNCSGDDDYDADADGFVANEYEGLVTSGVSGSGALRTGDCDDEDGNINPNSVDTWYDGIDTDCAGDDDYDADGDGATSVDYGGDDCFDGDPAVKPGATDAWKDGIDSDCAGNNDFDEDGDGWAPEGLGGRATLYAPDAPVVEDGDCDDADPDVNPGLSEVYYDGRDNDCDPATVDDDQDSDGFADDGTGTGEDCDDTDPAVNPDAQEVVTEGLDYDCDGDGATFADSDLAASGPAFDAEGSASFTGLRSIRLAAGPAHLWLAVGAGSMTLPLPSGDETAYDSIVAFGIPLEDSTRGIVRRQYLLFHPASPSDYSLGDEIDFVVVPTTGSGGNPADILLAAHSLTRSTERLLRIAGYNDVKRQNLGAYTEIPGTSDLSDLSLMSGDSEIVHAVGCDPNTGSLGILSASLSDLSIGVARTEWIEAGAGETLCQVDTFDDPGISLVSVDASGSAERSTYSRNTPSAGLTAAQSFPGVTMAEVDIPEAADARIVVYTSSSGTVSVSDNGSTVSISGLTATGAITAMVTGPSLGDPAPDLILSGTQSSGDGWFAVGSASTGFTLFDIAAGDGGTVSDAAAWIDERGNLHTFVVSDGALRYGTATY